MLHRLIIRLTALCILLTSVGVAAEIELPDVHSLSADQVVEASASIVLDAQADSTDRQHDDHCCHGHVMADPGIPSASSPVGSRPVKRLVSVSADSVACSPPVRPPKNAS